MRPPPWWPEPPGPDRNPARQPVYAFLLNFCLVKPRVVLGLSGGVDSAVAALLLLEEGYQVVGVMLRLEAGQAENSCCNAAAQARAAEVARRLAIPFVVKGEEDRFRRAVVAAYLEAHRAGRTPNPCVRCNPFVKFAGLFEVADRVGAAFVATGHYARREGDRLLRGRDPAKDQSYFLWGLDPARLGRLLFPLGGRTKPEVRALAEDAGLAVARTPESQNLCFVENDPKGFLKARLGARPGPVVDATTGEVVGAHPGAIFFTVGQKRGLGLFKSHQPRYVVATDPATNTVYVGPREAATARGLAAERPNYLVPPEDWPERVEVQVRHRARPVPARVRRADREGLVLDLEEPAFAVAPGQSAAVYAGEVLLGGGEIRAAMGTPLESRVPAAAG